MNKEMRDRIIDDVRRTIDKESDTPNFADVFWSYRLLLLRDPEFDDASSYARRSLPDLRQLSQSFLDSPEFQTIWGKRREPLPNVTVLAENDGLRFWFNLRDHAIGHNIAAGHYEPDITGLVQREVKPGMNCLDVGANLGYFSVVMARLVGRQGSVHSFEPFPPNYALLLRNIKENGIEGTVHPKQLATSDRNDKSSLFFRADEMNDNFGSMFVSDQAQDGHLQGTSVSRARLDDVVPPNLPIHFVKMDVEGSEIPALKGMSEIIGRYHPKLVIELNELALNRGNSSTPEELIGLLKDFGYSLREMGSNREYVLPAQRDGYLFTNLICTARGGGR